LSFACRFFGGGGGGGPFSGFPFGGGGGFQEEEEQIPKGNNVFVELEVTLKDLYLGNTFTVLLTSCSSLHIPSLPEHCPNTHHFRTVTPSAYCNRQLLLILSVCGLTKA